MEQEFSEFRESDISLKHKLRLANAVVASWSLTQELAGWQVRALLL